MAKRLPMLRHARFSRPGFRCLAYDQSAATSYQSIRQPFGVDSISRCLKGQLETGGLAGTFRLLDVGCGAGLHCRELSARFPRAEIIGVDSSQEMVAAARTGALDAGADDGGSLTYQVGDAMDLKEIPDASVDVLLQSQVLHHLPLPVRGSYATALREACRVLKPGGTLLVTVTRWAQRRHSYWSFQLMPEALWEKMAANDRWTCFEHTEEYPWTLTQAIEELGFKLSGMSIPQDSHWTEEVRGNVAAALTKEWRASEGCFAYMTDAEVQEFVGRVRALVRDGGALETFVEGVEEMRGLHGEGVVYAFGKQGLGTAGAAPEQGAAAPRSSGGRRWSPPGAGKGQRWVNLVSGRRTALDVQSLTPHGLVGVAKNVDLGSAASVRSLRQALWDFKALLIPASEMCWKPNMHLRLARLWGDIEEYHPINPPHHEEPMLQLLPTGGPAHNPGPDSFLWHNDMSWRPNPSTAGLLAGMVLPSKGGATLVADTNAAYEALPRATKDLLLRMTGHHDLEVGYARVNRPGTYEANAEQYDADAAKYNGGKNTRESYRSDHPAVIAHHVTGRPHLFVNPNFTESLSGGGISERECQEVFEEVCSHLKREEFHAEVVWQEVEAGSILIWDNHAVQHIAPADYVPEYRLMHRAVVVGPGGTTRFNGEGGSRGGGFGSWGECVVKAWQADNALAFYDRHAGDYAEAGKDRTVWRGPAAVAEAAAAFCKKRDGAVLDFGAGTGLLGETLKERGFNRLVAMDISLGMLAQIPPGIYDEIVNSEAAVFEQVCTYDLVVSSGTIGTHVPASVLCKLMPLVKCGGSIVFSCLLDAYETAGFKEVSAPGWTQEVVAGPLPLNGDMPDTLHVVARLLRT